VDCQVIVVGAGPVGLMLAGELALRGCSVVVLDALAEPTRQSRASVLHARSMEILDERGLLDRLPPAPVLPAGHFAGLPLGLGRVDSDFAGQWKVPQAVLERLLAGWAVGLGADLRRGHRLIGLDRDDDGVTARVIGPGGPGQGGPERAGARLRGQYLVGCDGQDSTVRDLARFERSGRAGRRLLLRADVVGITVPDRRFQRLDRGLAVAATRDGVTRLMMYDRDRPAGPGEAGEPVTFADVVRCWAALTGEDVGAGRPLWVDAFRDDCRQVTRYRQGRVLLAGDAAHQQLPTGGQAVNLGLHDAVNLGWKLAAQVAGWAPGDLLDSYHQERHRVVRRALTAIEAQASLLLGGPEVEPCRELLRELIGVDVVGEHLASAVAGLDVRYGGGAGDHPLVGARLGHHVVRTADGSTTSTTALLRDGRGVLLDLSTGGHRSSPAQIARPWSARLRVVTGAGAPDGALGDVRSVLVRPDGYVAWMLTPSSVSPLASQPRPALTSPALTSLVPALRRWFGAPAPVRAARAGR
jgi:2-polyprenyl-6-methoxyphenol hydroxylase-like FAD-dependent oxidoreductase